MVSSPGLKAVLGATELLSLVNAMLYGVLAIQCYIFLRGLKYNRPMLKYSVLALWVFNTMQTSFDAFYIYRYAVLKSGELDESSTASSWPEGGIVVATCFSNLVIQVWYTYRVYLLSNNRTLVMILATFVFMTSVFNLALGGYILSHTTFLPAQFDPLLYVAKSLDIVANFSVSATVCFYLARSRKHALARTRCILKLLAMYAAHTGLYGILIPLLVIVLRAMHPESPLYFAVLIPYSTLYSNSLLGSLNTQDWFCTDSWVITVPLDQLQWMDPADGKSLGGKDASDGKSEMLATMSA